MGVCSAALFALHCFHLSISLGDNGKYFAFSLCQVRSEHLLNVFSTCNIPGSGYKYYSCSHYPDEEKEDREVERRSQNSVSAAWLLLASNYNYALYLRMLG